MATPEELILFAEQILRPVGNNAEYLKNKKITGFLSMQGSLYNRELMVIGRAVNGWTDGIFPQDLTADHSINTYANDVYESVTPRTGCPMEWVADCWGDNTGAYNSARSAFWRVIRMMVDRLNIANVNSHTWPSYLVWSNLYKLAPEAGGNPGNKLCEIELPGCIDLLKLEIAINKPKRLLFLTGQDWAEPFLGEIRADMYQPTNDLYVKTMGKVGHGGDNVQVIVASHPQCKPSKNFVVDVCESFAQI